MRLYEEPRYIVEFTLDERNLLAQWINYRFATRDGESGIQILMPDSIYDLLRELGGILEPDRD